MITEKELILECISSDLLYLLDKKQIEDYLSELLQEGLITVMYDKFYIAKNKTYDADTFDDFIAKYRDLFSYKRVGVSGKMGNLQTVKKNMKKFIMETGLSYDEILKVTKQYINSVNDATYLMHAHYFIYKQDINKVVRSRLKAVIEENKFNQDIEDNFIEVL